MEFWGVEVKSGKPLKVQPELGKLVHISNAALGVVKDAKAAKNVPLWLKVGDDKFVIGTLSAEVRPHVMFDLVLEKEFELSHDWKNGSVYFVGYVADEPSPDDEGFPGESEDVSADELVGADDDGGSKPKSGDKNRAKPAAPGKGVNKRDGPDSSDDDDQEDDSSDLSGDDSDDSSHSSDAEEEMPKKLPQSKKRPAETAQETPPIAKKAKSETPDKSGNKKVPRTATPFPSKAAVGKKTDRPTPPTKHAAGKNEGPFNKGKKR